MKKIAEYTTIAVIGAALYSLIEIIWRGYTHWSMALLGGICFVLIYIVSSLDLKNGMKWFGCAVFITTLEFVFGVIFNLYLSLDVWNYDNIPFNLLGQICPLYSFLWFLLCVPADFFCKKLNSFFEKKRGV